MSLIARFFILISLALIAPSLLAHEGHGGGSLAQHALEHGFMLVPVLVATFFVVRLLYSKRAKSRLRKQENSQP